MKVALCLSGHMRTFEKTGPSIVNNIVKLTNADVFIHTWDSLGFDPGRGDQDSINLKTVDYLDKINEIFNPTAMVMEPFYQLNKDKYIDRVEYTRDPANVLGMFDKIKKCNQLKKDYEAEHNFVYDVVIRCRPDLTIDTPLDTSILNGLDSLYLPNFDFFLGFNDKFALGTSAIMDTYSSCIDFIEYYYMRGCIFNAESIMKQHIQYHSLPLKRCGITYTIYRMDGFKFSNT